jgi:hypothetical protein
VTNDYNWNLAIIYKKSLYAAKRSYASW